EEPSGDDADEEDEEQDEDDDDEEEEHQLRPTLFHLHLHFMSRLGYLLDPSRLHFAAAARPIEGRREDYGFVNSIEAEIR
nr:hypothetical protein [Tanacetum cinerariifolium]